MGMKMADRIVQDNFDNALLHLREALENMDELDSESFHGVLAKERIQEVIASVEAWAWAEQYGEWHRGPF